MRRIAAAGAPTLPEATLSEHDGVRYLHLGSVWVQGAMRIRRPRQIELEYVQRMLAALLWLPDPASGKGRAVQLGLGAGVLTRFTARELGMATTAVELNPQVVAACRRWFALPAEAEIVVQDAARWVREAEPASVRLLHVDLYDHEAAAPALDDLEFYAACAALLDDDGVMAVNLFGRRASFEQSLERLHAACGAARVWRLRATREGNTVVVATRSARLPEPACLQRRAEAIEARWGALGLPARKWLRMLRTTTG